VETSENRAAAAPQRFVVRRADAMKIVGLKSSAFDELRKRPDFPRPIWITETRPGWFADEIYAWLESRREPLAHG
jgi:predicted DNA-binding transcriptional regulator AlpA